MDKNIFKAYDIRGIYNKDFKKEDAKKIGIAFVKLLNAKKIAVGYDMRNSSLALKQNLIDGIILMGANVVDIGLVSTPMLNFAVGNDNSIDAGIMITASHNPSEYNGFKMTRGNMIPICGENGMEELCEITMNIDDEFNFKNTLIQKGIIIQGNVLQNQQKGIVIKQDILQKYKKKIFNISEIDLFNNRHIKIVIDAGNGVNGPVIFEVLKDLQNVEVIKLYFEPDGSFPNHEANPLNYKTLKELQKTVVELGADFGVAFDGDGDRIGVVDENGDIIFGDLLTALLAEYILKKQKQSGGKILYDIRSSAIVKEQVEFLGGEALPCRVGRSFIIQNMQQQKALLAGELSCHFYWKDFFCVESADLTLLVLLKIISQSKQKLSELVLPLKKYVQSGELNFEVVNKLEVINKLEEFYFKKALNINKLDGLKMEFENFWFSVRPSNTENLLRLNIEAKTKEIMQKVKVEICDIIKN